MLLTEEEIAVLKENVQLMLGGSTWQANWYVRDVTRLLGEIEQLRVNYESLYLRKVSESSELQAL